MDYYFNFKEKAAKYSNAIGLLKQHNIPEAWPPKMEDSYSWEDACLDEGSMLARDDVIHFAGYCFLSNNWLRPLASWIGTRKCLEIMGGSGALSKGLQNFGVDIRCTDDFSWSEQHKWWYEHPRTSVEQIGAVEAIQKYGKEVELVLCSWPYTDDACYHSLMSMREINPTAMMIYIGEGAGGCTVDEKFFETAIVVPDSEFQNAVREYRSAYCIHDRLVLIK